MKFIKFAVILMALNPIVGLAGPPVGDKITVLSKSIDPIVLQLALKGFSNIQETTSQKNNFLVIIDFSKASVDKRLYLISMKDTTLMYTDYVSHGKHSGNL